MTPDGDKRDTGPAAERVAVECLRCGRVGSLGGPVVETGLPLVQLTRRLRCSECGSRAVRACRVSTPGDVARALRNRMSPGRD
jgi:DNA-directed RNA polymerase subunit RPC12/RpoP